MQTSADSSAGTVRDPGRRPTVRQWIVLALWLAVAAAVTFRITGDLSDPIAPQEPFRGTERAYLDLRDTIWTPGRYLLGGGNPYDPDAYLAAHPWALPFSLYAPAWLLLAIAFAPLPYLLSLAAFQVASLAVAVVMVRTLCRWTLPTVADLAVPVLLLWMNIWYPGRGALSTQMGSLLAVLGAVLVLRALLQPVTAATAGRHQRPATTVDLACALGVALSLIKVQFGAFALVALVGGRRREVWRGVLGMTLASLPVVIVCSVIAGGPVEFVRSVLRDIAVLSSDAGPTGLSYPTQERFDVVGQLARHGLVDPPAWVELGVPLLGLVAALVVVRISRNPLLVSAVVCTSTLVGIYHGRYDVLLLLIPVAVGVGMAIRGELTSVAERLTLGLLSLVVLHLHAVSKALIPGVDVRTAATVDLVLILAALAVALCGAVSSRAVAPRRSDVEPSDTAR